MALLGAIAPAIVQAAAPERGVAVIDAAVLRELDLREQGAGAASLSLAAMLGAPANANSADVLALPSMQKLRAALEREFQNYQLRDLQPFDREALYAPLTRFILAGIVNRMDRAFVAPETCGEIRLIYRPVANYGAGENSTRLPMTLNLILNAKGEGVTCAEVARRWRDLEKETATGADLAQKLAGTCGALESIPNSPIDSIETNIQIGRASVDPNDFLARADYLMKVFKYDSVSKSFVESVMENQLDRDRLLADPKLAAEFKQWLLAPDRLAALDRGTILIPDKFLATRAITVTPASESGVRGIISDSDVVEALAKASADGAFDNIKSPAGFERRLSDNSCTGCHQTRAIGGFHFLGVDWSGDPKGMVTATGSPHFVGDQPRRRDILVSLSDGKIPDFSRGFSARPQDKRSGELKDTTFLNGWGAQCYAPGSAPPDRSFSTWTCAEGLSCQMPPATNPGAMAVTAGLCFPKTN